MLYFCRHITINIFSIMKKILSSICAGTVAATMLMSCAGSPDGAKSYNEGINIIPMPQDMVVNEGGFSLSRNTVIGAAEPDVKSVAEYFAGKISGATGYDIKVADEGDISLEIDTTLETGSEGYTLDVTSDKVLVKAKTAQGVFYGMQSFMQLLPAEIENGEKAGNMSWTAQAVSIKDEPRFSYRGVLLDACRHFISVEDIKKQIDVLAMFKINRLHWHLTDDQGWRIEIKKYPKLTEIGSKRIEGEGYEYGGYYTQEQIKDVVKYAADRFITIVPEIELPGHEMAAIAAYPELSCKGEQGTPRIIWGVEDIVMCAGKEEPFEFMTNVIEEVAALFPGEYFHIGGDECPKTSWKNCPLCQKRIREEGLWADGKHTAEEKLQSYFVKRMEKVVERCGKKMIGWDEILEGGLAPSATVMSWRGEEGGIESALMGHDVIMTPGSEGLYIDYYQGDPKIEPVAICCLSTLETVYDYNPVPDTLVQLGKDKHILGVQVNLWAEYLYSTAIREYRMYPRALALAEIAWTNVDRKDYNDFERRINNAYVRLDAHGINYHIPQPEQPEGSCNFVAFTDSTTLTFRNTRNLKMVYTLDGSEPTAASAEYAGPLYFDKACVLKIATALPSGKLSPVRTIKVEKQELAAAKQVEGLKPGLKMSITYGTYLNVDELAKSGNKPSASPVAKELRELGSYEKSSESMRGVKQYAAIAEGYVNIPEDGVYYLSSELEEVWIDGKLLINNRGEVKKFSRTDTSVALAAGLHEVKAVFLGHIIGGWPSNWSETAIRLRKADAPEFSKVTGDMLFHN